MGRILTLGEIMLRFSTPVGDRLGESHQLLAHYGGGEANVAISLANFGHDVSYASKVPDNALGYGVKKYLHAYQVKTDFLLLGGPRLGTYYLETGVGQRPASVIYDRAHSSFADMNIEEWDLETLFKGVTLFHISGITAALSQSWQVATLKLIQTAKEKGCKISFDINYRGKLWTQEEAGEFLKQVLPHIDYCSAGSLDARYLLGIDEKNNSENQLMDDYQEIQKRYPNITVLYSTKREIISASNNSLSGTIWINKKFYQSKMHQITPIVDRVGGGDAFAAGVLHGLILEMEPQELIDFATAASALKHTVHGDCNPFSVNEIKAFLASGTGKISR